jgi:periplasmic copper chaperone A
MKRGLGRAVVGAGAVAALVGVPWSTASAHVSIITYGDVEAGGFATIGFNVPNERDDSGTVALAVQMPPDHPFTSVRTQPKPGWEIETTTRTVEGEDVVDTITWTASDGSEIAPGQFDQFWISVGRLPEDVAIVEFPAVQTYASGEEVRWIEPTPAGGEEPEHPAPALALTAPSDDAAATDSAGSDSGDSDSTTLAVIALVVGGLGLVTALAGLVMTRRRVG